MNDSEMEEQRTAPISKHWAKRDEKNKVFDEL
jgi:hypothetical protein